MAARGIRSRLLISLLLMAIVVVGVALPLANGLIQAKFSAFELGKARDDADRLQLVLSERIDRLRTHAVDYADWTDTAAYIRGTYPGYLQSNFDPGVLENFDADHVFVLDGELKLRYAASLQRNADDPGLDTLRPMTTARLSTFLAEPRVRDTLARDNGIGFVAWLGDRWFLLGVAAIMDPEAEPPLEKLGLVAFVTELTPARVAGIEHIANVPLALAQTPSGEEGSILSGDDVLTRRPLPDTSGQPAAWIDIHYPRPLLEQTRIARQLLLALSVGIFVVGSLLVWRIVDRGVITRLEQMQRELQAMTDGERHALSPGTHGDEVDLVADRINRLYAEVKLVSGQWRHEAMHDALTGLGNRANLLQQIEARLAGGGIREPIALVLVDLDGFKAINDLFGHAMGDHVLIQVAVCLRDQFSRGAQSFRLGGDEFAVLAPCANGDEALALAGTINDAIAALDLAGMSRGIVGGSIGVALASPGGADLSANQLLQRADVALYNVKRQGRNGRALFDDAMLRDMQLRNDLLRSLDQAISDGGLEPWFQPIVAAEGHGVLRFEVLARWHHPGSGWIDPARFVAIAELNNMAASLDLAVLERALRALPQLHQHAPDLALSVNVSAQSLLDDAYVQAVTGLLAKPANRGIDLTLEITETAFTDNEEALVAPVAALQALGVRIVLDDFGVGYSSLARLAHIQPSGIKLDGSFVRNRRQGGDRICRAVIALAHEFDIAVTAEWIETAEDAECLRDWHCDALQGFHFAPPMRLDDALAWLAARRVVA